MKKASINAKQAVNAIRFERIPPMGPTILLAPIEMASKIFLASLKQNMIEIYLNFFQLSHPLGKFFIASQLALVFFVSG